MYTNLPPGVMTLEQAKPYLEPVAPTLLDGFWESWEWAKGLVGSNDLASIILNSSTMAGIVSDAFGYFCRPRLISEFRAEWTTNGRFQHARISGLLSLRFKKLTPDLYSMNVKTEAQRRVYQQEEAKEPPVLPGAQRVTQVTLGYTLNFLRTTPTGIYFVCPVDFDSNGWIWPLYQAGDGTLDLFDGLPPGSGSIPDGPIEDVLDVQIRVKRPRTKKG